jgi:hypothetical protein
MLLVSVVDPENFAIVSVVPPEIVPAPDVPDEPVDPELPDEPVDPELPEDPVLPEDPLDPVDPELPDDPVLPLDPEDPVDPELPDDPDDPEVPADPDVPLIPIISKPKQGFINVVEPDPPIYVRPTKFASVLVGVTFLLNDVYV